MVSEIRQIAILAAMSSEMTPIRRELGLDTASKIPGSICSGTYRGTQVITVVTNMGLIAAENAAEKLFRKYGAGIDHLLVVGIGGGVDPGLRIGQVVVPESVVDERDGVDRYPDNLSTIAPSGTIYSIDALHYDDDFVAMLRRRNALLVDMESGAIAAVCERHHCPFTVIRAVSDRTGAQGETYELFQLANEDGSPNYSRALGFILRKPWKIGYLLAVGFGSRKAIQSASVELVRCIDTLISTQPE